MLDLVFYEGDQFPAEYKGSPFVALKGSWNRSIPTGYKVVRVPFKDRVRGAMTAHSWLGLKFATWQNNGILPANNEFHSAEQRINNGNRPSAKNIAMAADGPRRWSLISLIEIGTKVVSHIAT